MKKIAFKSLLLVTPFVIYCIIITCVDPFDLFNSKFISKEIKLKYTTINYALWKMIDFQKNPTPNVLLGDSRVGRLNSNLIEELSGYKYYNFSYGGGNLQEIINTFWHISSITKLENVYIGINLELYNKSNSRDRVKGAISIISNPLLYFTNQNVMEASYYCFKDIFSDQKKISNEIPDMSKEEFWNYQIKYSGPRYFLNYQYPENYFMALKKIADYCNSNNINLVFIIMPNHSDLIDLISNLELENDNHKFIMDLIKLGNVYNFNLKNNLTTDKNNFLDPFHAKQVIADSIISIIWKKKIYEKNDFYIYYTKNSYQ